MIDIKIDKLIRSKRKSIGLQITNDARLIVRAPFFASEDHIRNLILHKETWIKTKQEYFKERQNRTPSRKYVPGEEFMFLGRNYPLKAVENLGQAIVFDDALLICHEVLGNARDHLENWYRTQALEYIPPRVEHFAQIAHLRYRSIRINQATTRWGSCGWRNSLNFTWKLIMAPANVIDYVIIHELMHLKQKNHSHKFWAEVANMMPDYKEHELWLKNNSHILQTDSK